MNDELRELIEIARVRWNAMPPEEKAAMIAAQMRSYVLSEASFGSDADEAAYRVAVERNDLVAIARLDAEADARMRRARAALGGRNDPEGLA